MIPQSEWKWYGLAAHFICADRCQFHLTTEIGPYVVSTVGSMSKFDGSPGMEEIGCGRFFETMVFEIGARCGASDCGCNIPVGQYDNLDFAGYKTAGEAQAGHMAMCQHWAEKAGAK